MRTSLPGGTISCDSTVLGAAAWLEALLALELLAELLDAAAFTLGTGVPGRKRNAADGSPLVAAVHGGTITSRVPCPWGSESAVEPVVASTARALCEVTLAPVAHGVTMTVRALSAVGTMTSRDPSLTFVPPPFVTSMPPITMTTIRPAMTEAATRLPGIRGARGASVDALALCCPDSEPIAPTRAQLLPLLDADGAVHGEAVAVEDPFVGTTVLCWPPELELLELELLDEELDDSTQGGTISVVTPLLAGSRS